MELEVFEAQMIHAACRDCVFASYDGKTQVDCLAGELAAHRANPHVSVEECTDGDKEFFVINGGACKFQRNADWVKARGLENAFDTTLYYAAKDEVDAARIKVALVILVDQACNDQDSIESSIHEIQLGKLLPAEVTFLLPNDDKSLKVRLITALREIARFKWNVLEPKEEQDVLSLIDVAVAKFDAQYYCVAPTPHPDGYWLRDVPSDIDQAIRVDGERFLALWPIDGTYAFMTAQVFAHKHFGRNAEVATKEEYGDERRLTTIVEKLAFIAKDLGKEYLVKEAKEVFKWLK